MESLNRIVALSRFVVHLILLCIVWSFALVDFECVKDNDLICPSYQTRKELIERGNVLLALIICMIIQIGWIFYYHLITKHGIKNVVATNDRRLAELLKLQDNNGIKELIEFGFIFDKNEYIDVFYDANYNAMGCNILADVMITLSTRYKFNYQFQLTQIHDFKNTRLTYRMIEFLIDLKQKNPQKLQEIERLYPKIDCNFKILAPTAAEQDYIIQVRDWAYEWFSTNANQFAKFDRYSPTIGRYISKFAENLDIIFNSRYNNTNYEKIYVALSAFKKAKKPITININEENFSNKFQRIIGLLTDLKRYDEQLFNENSNSFPKFGVKNLLTIEDLNKMKSSLPNKYDQDAVSTMFKSILQLKNATSFDDIQNKESTLVSSDTKSMEFKCVVLGAGDVGKSSLVTRFVNGYFEEGGYDPTIEDSYHTEKSVTMADNKEISVLFDLLDTQGRDEYSSLRDQWCREANYFYLVYNVEKKWTLEDLEQGFLSVIGRVHDLEDADNQLGIIVAGTRCEAFENGTSQITKEEGPKFADRVVEILADAHSIDTSDEIRMNKIKKTVSCKHFYVSAKTEANIDNSFFELARMCYSRGGITCW